MLCPCVFRQSFKELQYRFNKDSKSRSPNFKIKLYIKYFKTHWTILYVIFDSELHFGTQLFCPLGTAAEEIYIPPEVQVTENHDGWQQPISPSQPHQSGPELFCSFIGKEKQTSQQPAEKSQYRQFKAGLGSGSSPPDLWKESLETQDSCLNGKQRYS